MNMRKLFAGLAAAATLLSGLALGATTASAADVVTNDKGVVTSNATFTFTSDNADQWGTNNNRVIKAYKIGDFVKQGDSYTVATPTYPAAAKATLKSAIETALKGKGENGADVTVPANVDPLQWALQNNYLDTSASKPYTADNASAANAGTTRKLADALQSEATKDTPDFAVTELSVAKQNLTKVSDTTYTASLPAGIYLFLDVTTDGHITDGTVDDQNKDNDQQTQGKVVVNSAPIILSSGELKDGQITNPIANNTINFKNHVTPITKSHNDTDNTVSTGQELTYKLATTLPAFTTGYTNYQFKVTDTPGAGQDIDLSNISVTIDGTPLNAYNATSNPTGYELSYTGFGTNPTPTDGKFSADGTKSFVVDLSKYVQASTYDATKTGKVVITYKAKITSTKTSAGDNGVVNSVEVNDNNNTAKDETKVTLGKFSFTKTDADGNALKDAQFKIEAKEGAGAVTPTVSTATSAQNGVVTFDGLADGTYVVTETNAPEGFLDSTLAKFEVTIKGGVAVYFNGTDAWGLAGDSGSADSKDEITNYAVKNVKSIAELPKTGAAGIAMFGLTGLLLAAAAGTVFLKSRSTKRALRA